MRDPTKNITILQKQLNELQLENQLLKNILDRSGISYVQELKLLKEPEFTESFDPDQGARIRHPREITEKMVKVFLREEYMRLNPEDIKVIENCTTSLIRVAAA